MVKPIKSIKLVQTKQHLLRSLELKCWKNAVNDDQATNSDKTKIVK